MKVRTWGALVRIPVVYDLKMLLGREMLFLEKSQVVYFECFFSQNYLYSMAVVGSCPWERHNHQELPRIKACKETYFDHD